MTQGRVVSKKTDGGSTLPEIGKIKIGEKKKSSKGVEYPSSIDYFKPTGNFVKAFEDIYGEKPTRLEIVFMSNDLSEVCNERFECWTDGKRHGVGDGETFTVWDGDKYVDNLPKSDPRVTKLKWDLMLTLRFVLVKMTGILGYWTFQTKAKATTIPSVVKSFDFVKERAGSIVGFPFTLMVEKKKGYNPGEARNYPVVTLVPNFSTEAIEMVSNYIDQGGNMNKITTSMIEGKKGLQLAQSNPTPTEAPQVSVEATLFPDEK